MRDKFFQIMYDYKFAIFYLEAYLEKTIKNLRTWKILIAVGSSVSIACWTAWTQYAYWWGLIIVVAQVASVILEYLPYEYRKEELSKAITIKSAIFTDMEHSWDEINVSDLNDKEIADLLYKYTKRWDKAESELFKNESLSQNDKLRIKAENSALAYFSNIYGDE